MPKRKFFICITLLHLHRIPKGIHYKKIKKITRRQDEEKGRRIRRKLRPLMMKIAAVLPFN